MTAAISPIGDTDYYSVTGVNPTWGFIALLDTTGSSSSNNGTITALRSDGINPLQSDTGSWERGSGIALQNYVNGSDTHYLRVDEEGNDATISGYELRYYNTVTDAQPEIEPNDTRSSGTPSSFTHSGVINSNGDIDCFAFQGRTGDKILLALNGDPEDDGSTIDPVLELVGPTDVPLKAADASGTGGKEFIEYAKLSSDGVYAYCVHSETNLGGPSATYKVGLVRNGGLYFPTYIHGPTWINPRPGNIALVGDLLSFRLAITNTSPLAIPGNIRITTHYSSTCLDLVSAVPPATTTSPGYVSWDGQKTGLAPDEVYSVVLNVRALSACNQSVYQDTGVAYYFTGHGDEAYFTILGSIYLPLVSRVP